MIISFIIIIIVCVLWSLVSSLSSFFSSLPPISESYFLSSLSVITTRSWSWYRTSLCWPFSPHHHQQQYRSPSLEFFFAAIFYTINGIYCLLLSATFLLSFSPPFFLHSPHNPRLPSDTLHTHIHPHSCASRCATSWPRHNVGATLIRWT